MATLRSPHGDIPVPSGLPVRLEELRTLSYFQNRVLLASRGWMTECFARRWPDNKIDFSVRILRRDWMGALSDVSAVLKLGPDFGRGMMDVETLAEGLTDRLSVLHAFAIALPAQFPDSVPHIMPYEALGQVRMVCSRPDWQPHYHDAELGLMASEHKLETEYFRSYPSARVVCPERSKPTESLPGWPGHDLKMFLDQPDPSIDYLSRFLEVLQDVEVVELSDRMKPVQNGFNARDRVWMLERQTRSRAENSVVPSSVVASPVPSALLRLPAAMMPEGPKAATAPSARHV